MKKVYSVEKSPAGYYYFVPDQLLVEKLTRNNNRRVVCVIQGEVTLLCAIQKTSEGLACIKLSHKTCKALGLREKSKISAELSVDTSDYQFAMVEELQEVLKTDPEASDIFHNFTPGKQRSLIYLVSAVKSSEKRIERALKIADRIKRGITAPNLILK